MLPVQNGSAARSHLEWTPQSSNASSGDSPPPPYQKSPENASLGTRPAGFTEVKPTPRAAADTAQSLFAPHFRAHDIIGIYQASYSDMMLALSATDASPLSYISTHAYSRPHLALHATASPSSAILATAEFQRFTGSATIVASSPAGPVAQPLQKDGFFGSAWVIYVPVPPSGVRERFEWRNSSAVDVQRLEGRTPGMSLVRVGTGEVMAVYAGVSRGSTREVGKLRWVGGRDGRTDIGSAGELLCVMSLLALLEKARRSKNRSSTGAMGGVAIGVAVGSAVGYSGGAGC